MNENETPETAQSASAPAEPSIPGEFVLFLRQTGIRAFDRFAKHIGTPAEGKSANPLQSLAAAWRGMRAADKNRFFDQIIAGGAIITAAAAPAVVRAARSTARRRSARKAATARKSAAPKVPMVTAGVSLSEKDKKKKAAKSADEKALKKARKAEKKLEKEARKEKKKLKKSGKEAATPLPKASSPS